MKIYKIIFLVCFFLVYTNCSTKKDILYLQDVDNSAPLELNYEIYKVKIDDVLKIEVITESPETSLIFRPNGFAGSTLNSKEALLYNGYQVNSKGNIFFSNLGELHVVNKTISEIRQLIYNKIISEQLLVNPSVDVKLLNSFFTILGEVKNPGRYDFFQNNLNVFEAIGLAGDLTINGERKKVKLIRNFNNKVNIIDIDLTSKDFINKVGFQIIAGDIIIVNPNSSRIKNAGIIGNSGTLLSLLSFILSSIIVINN